MRIKLLVEGDHEIAQYVDGSSKNIGSFGVVTMWRSRKEAKARNVGMLVLWVGTTIGCLSPLLSSHKAKAHSWYPQRCCGGQECRKVDKIDFLPNGDMVMHVGWMEVVVPRNFAKQPSQDADAHVCISFATGTFRPVCVFMPGTS